MHLNSLLNQVAAVKLNSAVNGNSVIVFNEKEFHIISSKIYSNSVLIHRHICSNSGTERIRILHFDSGILYIMCND